MWYETIKQTFFHVALLMKSQKLNKAKFYIYCRLHLILMQNQFKLLSLALTNLRFTQLWVATYRELQNSSKNCFTMVLPWLFLEASQIFHSHRIITRRQIEQSAFLIPT